MARTPAASPRPSTGKAAAVSATTAWRRRCWKRTVGQLGHQQDYNAAMLAEALCKLEGFTYAPSEHLLAARPFHRAGFHLRHHGQPEPRPAPALSDEVGPERTLLVLCTAFRARADRYPNLTVKKIPRAVLARCEWGHDDYSLQGGKPAQARRPKGQMRLMRSRRKQL